MTSTKTNLPEVPEWLFKPAYKKPGTDIKANTTGSRNMALTSEIGRYLSGNKAAALQDTIDYAQQWNTANCSPSLPAFEVKNTAKSIYETDLRNNGPKVKNSVREVVLVQGSTIQPEHIVWAWNGWFPLGKLAIVAGQPGTGKTTVLIAILTAITI